MVLGEDLEGSYADIVENMPSRAPSAFKAVFDEFGAYATNGMDKMLAMARSLSMEFNLGFQEIASIKAALGTRAAAVLGNPNTVVALRLQEPETGEMIEKIGGETRVAQVSQQAAGKDILGTFRAPDSASIMAAKRYNWLDLRALKEGQAILSYGNIMVHANMFYCPAPHPEHIRINRLLMMTPPDRLHILRHQTQVNRTRSVLLSGPDEVEDDQPPSDTLMGLIEAFAAELTKSADAQCAAMAAVLACPDIAGR